MRGDEFLFVVEFIHRHLVHPHQRVLGWRDQLQAEWEREVAPGPADPIPPREFVRRLTRELHEAHPHTLEGEIHIHYRPKGPWYAYSEINCDVWDLSLDRQYGPDCTPGKVYCSIKFEK